MGFGCNGLLELVLPGRSSTPPDIAPATRGRGAVRRRYQPDARKPRLGSSSSSKVGRPIRARAIASICCSPPDLDWVAPEGALHGAIPLAWSAALPWIVLWLLLVATAFGY